MCTSFTYVNQDFYFGRNLDLDCGFGEEVVITPRQYPFLFRHKETIAHHYAMIGMATVIDNTPLYAEAVNEKGLGMAGLQFSQNAVYFPYKEDQDNIASFEIIPWILSQCETVKQARQLLERINVLDIAFKDSVPNSSLHWILADKDQSIVIESVQEGLKIYDNPFGVLTNNPPFDYHKINISNYMNLSCKYPENRFTDKIDLEVFGQGISMIGLPGDVTPPARFVRAAFNKSNSVECSNENEAISQFFHILDSVAMLKGTVLTKENKLDMTTYSSCINASKGIYYFKTYYNNQINAVKFNENNINSKELEIHELPITQNVKYLN